MAGVYDNEEQLKKHEGIEDKRRQREQSDLMKVLSMPEGRRVVWRLFGISGIGDEIFSGENHALTDFNLGKRSVGLAFWKQTPPETELVMKREAASDKLLRDQELTNSDSEPKEKDDAK